MFYYHIKYPVLLGLCKQLVSDEWNSLLSIIFNILEHWPSTLPVDVFETLCLPSLCFIALLYFLEHTCHHIIVKPFLFQIKKNFQLPFSRLSANFVVTFLL